MSPHLLVFLVMAAAIALAQTSVASDAPSSESGVVAPPAKPVAVQGGRTLLDDDDTVVVRAREVWEDSADDVLHFEGEFDMRTREWRILAGRATAYGPVNDPNRIVVTGAPAKVWIERNTDNATETQLIYGEGAELEYLKSNERLFIRGDAVLIEQGNRLTSAEIEYDLEGDRFKAGGQQGVEIVVEADRAPTLPD